MGSFALPLQASNSDIPININTAPQLKQAAFGNTLDSVHEGSLVIVAYVDSNGRVQDYRVVIRFRAGGAVVAGGEEYVDFHYLPSGNLDGYSHLGPGRIVVLEDQREGIAKKALTTAGH